MSGARRRERLIEDLDIAQASGLLMGALDAPVVRRSEGPVRYVEIADLRARRRPLTAPSELDAVDIVWAGRRLRNAAGGQVDYIIAVGLIERTPDLIGWLRDLADALKPDGVLSLAVPDHRYTVDLRRPPSTLGEAVEAHLLQARRPSIRQMADSCALAVAVTPEQAWSADLDPAALPSLLGEEHALSLAWDQARRMLTGSEYIDSRCWLFTPASFLELLDQLARLELLPFRLADLRPTQTGDAEFYVRLTPAAPKATDDIRASIDAFRAVVAPPPPSPEAPTAHEPPPLPMRAARKLKRMLLGS